MSFDSRIEGVCISVDACLHLFIFIMIAVSCVGACMGELVWQKHIHEVMFNCVEESELVL